MHVFAVCQPSVPVLAAVALMEQDNETDVPLSMTLAGGPVDTRVNPTIVNTLAVQRGTDWFRRNVVASVPWPNPGFGRMVYPGFLQLTGFMTMNLDRHMKAHATCSTTSSPATATARRNTASSTTNIWQSWT